MLSKQGTNATISDVALGVGVGAAVGAVATWVLFPRHETIVAPTVGSRAAGLMVTHPF